MKKAAKPSKKAPAHEIPASRGAKIVLPSNLEEFVAARPRLAMVREASDKGGTVGAAADIGTDTNTTRVKAASTKTRKPGRVAVLKPSATTLRLEANRRRLAEVVTSAEAWEAEAARRLAADGSQLSPEVANVLLLNLGRNAEVLSKALGQQERWHAAMKAAERAVAFRTGGSPARKTGPKVHLQLAYCRFMLMGNSPKLRDDLKRAAQLYPKDEAPTAWQARYLLMSSNFEEASQLIKDFEVNNPGRISSRIHFGILPLLADYGTARPEEAWPCNFYTYQHTLMDADAVTRSREWLANEVADVQSEQPKHRAARALIDAWDHWNQGATAFAHNNLRPAETHFLSARRAVLDYFIAVRPDLYHAQVTDEAVYAELSRVAANLMPSRKIHLHFRHRHQTITLKEIFEQDWERPLIAPSGMHFYRAIGRFLDAYHLGFEIDTPFETAKEKIEEKAHAPMLALGMVHCGFALAETRLLRGNHEGCITECKQLLKRHNDHKLLSQVIEVPFIKLIRGRALLAKGDNLYKARKSAQARDAYREVPEVFRELGDYARRVRDGFQTLRNDLSGQLAKKFHPLAPGLNAANRADAAKLPEILGRLPVNGITQQTVPGVAQTPRPSLIRFTAAAGRSVTNPLIYQLILQATGRLHQLNAGLNYLGYSDDYVPPWRFHHLLERARYFTAAAKTNQSDYLSFLTNAEQAEYQELTAAQQVAGARQNTRIEAARVEEARSEVEAAIASRELAEMVKQHAQERMNQKITEIAVTGVILGAAAAIALPAAVAAGGVALGSALQSTASSATGVVGSVSQLFDLSRAIEEADASFAVADASVGVAIARVETAVCQRAAALMSYEFAVQAHEYLLNRTTSAELWFRLAGLAKALANASLDRAIQMAFLAEQAYEFEFDKQKNVIRFDYGVDETAGLLAADFLSSDLDELERDLLTGQIQKQQVIRHVVSLAQEFPAALEELRHKGVCVFSLSLESLERRLAGALNLRIGTVEIRPMGLMSPLGFVAELTCLGDGQVRLPRASSVSATEPSWATQPLAPALSLIDQTWPMVRRLAGPEASLFSGASMADEHAASPSVLTAQRNAFERLPAACSWRVDMNLQRNRIVPGSLADLQIVFHLVAYHDPLLRAAIESTPPRPRMTAQVISARKDFADGFYELVHTGRMTFSIDRNWLNFQPPPGPLRNLALVLIPSAFAPRFNNLFAVHDVVVKLDAAGTGVVFQQEPPQFQFKVQRLKVDADVTGLPGGAVVSWRFGVNGAWTRGAQLTHNFDRPGAFDVTARIQDGHELREFDFEVNVRDDLDCSPPVTAYPKVQLSPAQPGGLAKVRLSIDGNPAGEALSMQLAEAGVEYLRTGASVDLEMAPGHSRRIRITIGRDLQARFDGFQNVKPALVPLSGLRTTTNRMFDPETLVEDPAHAPNAFSQHLFQDQTGVPVTLSPLDEWQLEVPLANNPFLAVADSERVGLQHIHDAVLILEHVSEA